MIFFKIWFITVTVIGPTSPPTLSNYITSFCLIDSVVSESVSMICSGDYCGTLCVEKRNMYVKDQPVSPRVLSLVVKTSYHY